MFLNINAPQMRASGFRTVNTQFAIALLPTDQEGQEVVHDSPLSVFQGKPADAWGGRRFLALEQLRPGNSPYLDRRGRMLLRADLSVLSIVAVAT